MIKAITFDLDDTLWPIDCVIESAEKQLYDYLQEHCPRIAARLDPNQLREHREKTALLHPRYAHDFSALRTLSLQALMVDHDYPENLADDAFNHFQMHRNRINFYDDVTDSLECLATQYTLAGITNGNACPSQTGVNRWLQHITCAREVGYPKPHPAIFQVAIKKLQCRPDQVLHVGDHPEHDVSGADAVGMHSVWLDRSRTGQSTPGALASIFTLAELEPLLQTL